ncbi:hypothetical protein [Arthrobacter psychrolactophilus]
MNSPEILAQGSTETRWLSAQEQQLWLELREFSNGLSRTIDRQLAQDAELSGVEYAVLAAVSEAPPEGVRSGDLAEILSWTDPASPISCAAWRPRGSLLGVPPALMGALRRLP